jgi:hypothetical protein
VAEAQVAQALGVCRDNEVRLIPRTWIEKLMNILAVRTQQATELLYSASLIPPPRANTYNTFKPLDQEEESRAPHHVQCRHQACRREPPAYLATRIALTMASSGQEWRVTRICPFQIGWNDAVAMKHILSSCPSLPHMASTAASLDSSATTHPQPHPFGSNVASSRSLLLLLLTRLTSTLLLVLALSLPDIHIQQLPSLGFLAPLDNGASTNGATAERGWRRFRSNLH